MTEHFVQALGDGGLTTSNQRVRMFFDHMLQSFHWRPRITLFALLIIYEERFVAAVTSELSSIKGQSMPTAIEEIVKRDLRAGYPLRERIAKRILANLGFDSVAMYNHEYESAKYRIEHRQFTAELHGQVEVGNRDLSESYMSAELRARAAKLGIVLDLSEYIIVGPDHSRDSKIDRFYMNNFRNHLADAFDGRCCNCGEGMSQLEFDHFWCPKNQGGCFAMRHKKSRLYANNCVPLCRTCNASKGKRKPEDFFGDRFIQIASTCQLLNPQLNDIMQQCDDDGWQR